MNVAENLKTVHQKIAESCNFANRLPHDVTLIAVSKTKTIQQILPALQAGHRVFGENRVQEATEKWEPLKQNYQDIDLHLIGPLQTNKVNQALKLFDFIHTVDRESLATALSKKIPDSGRTIGLTIQVNTGEEPQKSGILPTEADDFITHCIKDLKLPIAGLMCIPPVTDEPTPHFALLKTMVERHHLTMLSMGMSGDFKWAVRFGATHVRLGSAIFGSR